MTVPRSRSMEQQTEGEGEQVRGRRGAHRAKASTMEAAVKEAGKYRQEGKNYVVKDGDIIFFNVNVTADKKK